MLQEVCTLIHPNAKAWASVLTDQELGTSIDLLHRFQDGAESAWETEPGRE